MPSHNNNGKFYICTTKMIDNLNRQQKKCLYSQRVCDATTILKKRKAISSMCEFSGQLKWKKGPYAFEYRFSLTSFQLHMIEPSEAQSKNTINGTKNIHNSYTQNN